MVVKRGRGRPKKLEAQNLNDLGDSSLNMIATAVNQVTRKRPPRRAASTIDEGGFVEPNVLVSNEAADDEDDDFVPTELIEIDDDEDEEVRIEEIDENTRKKSPKPRGKPKAVANNVNGEPKSGSRLEKKRRKIRYLKDLSAARDKIERLYGMNREKLLGLAKVKEAFETCVFFFASEKLQKDSPCYVDCIPPCAKINVYEKLILSNPPKWRQIEEQELDSIFMRKTRELLITIGEAEVALSSGQKTEFPVFPYGERRGFVYNVGGLVTDMEWLYQEGDEHQYLAVSVSHFSMNPSDEHLQMFDTEKHVSSIEIFKLNTATLQFSKIQTIVHTFGETWDLKWHEGCTSSMSLGTLAFVCQDGSVKFLEINGTEEYRIKFIEEPSISLSLPRVSITCYDFLSPTKVVCGFKNGFVGEFDLENPLVPSFYRKVHDSYVISICVAYSEFENPVIGTVSVDGFFYVFDPRDIFTTKTTITRFRGTNIIPLSYVPQLYAFLNSDGLNSLKTVVPRAAFGIHSVCLQDTTITSIGTSRKHPLSLTGTADGNVVISNVARRLLTGVKNGSSVHSYLRLWKWEYNDEEQKYILNHAYEKSMLSLNEVSGIKIDPHGVSISCIKWNETCVKGSFYAFANNAGLLTIEEMGVN